MNNILFLVDAWAPKSSANVVCIKNLISCFPKDLYRIFCSSLSQSGSCEIMHYEGATIEQVLPGKARKLYYKADLSENVTEAKRLRRKANRIYKLKKILNIKNYPFPDKQFSLRWAKSLREKIEQCSIDIVISVDAPVESIQAGEYLKKWYPKIKWFIYMIDHGAHENLKKADDLIGSVRIKLEKLAMSNMRKAFMLSDAVFIMAGHKEHYFQDYYKNVWDKIDVVNVPLLKREKISHAEKEVNMISDKSNWVYMGAIGGQYYDPIHICRFFKTYGKRNNAVLHFFGRGAGIGYITEEAANSNGTIMYHGLLEHEKVQTVLRKADVLLYFITKDLAGSVSGKFFEYLTAEKPIVYFSSAEQDINTQYVEKCSHGLVVRPGLSINDQIELVNTFLNRDMIISFEEDRKTYYLNTPEASVKSIINRIKMEN